MYKIQANQSGTRSIEVSEENLKTIRDNHLFQWLLDSNGLVTEEVLEKLRLNVRSILTSSANVDKPLLDLCIDVIYHNDMKALGLHNLMSLYGEWVRENPESEPENEDL